MMDERREGRPTAYVLGEMTPEETATFEAELKDSAELRSEVAELREMAALLGREMATELASLPADVRARIEAAASEKAKVIPLPIKAKRPLLQRAGFWLAAATVALAVPAALVTFNMERRASEARTPDGAPASLAAEPAPTATANAVYAQPVEAPAREQNERSRMEEKSSDAPALMPGRASKAGGKEKPKLADPQTAGNRHDGVEENPFLEPRTDPLSTFSIDVDTASYALVRTYLKQGSMPPSAAVRIEEMINYFGYAYPEPDGDVPFRVNLDLGVAPWAAEHHLVRVGLKGKSMKLSAMDGVNLVFLVDTSGSMSEANKLPLLKQGFRMMVDKLGPNDRVAIVAYAGSAGLVLPSTSVSEKSTVLAAIDRLASGGSTNGGAGIDLAYKVAAQNFLKGGVNRVILATDGDFNVGTTSQEQLVSLIQDKAKTGVFLSVLGFGMGNFNDSLLEKIADKGNGQYAYIDNETEAKRALVDGLGSLVTIAKDVKIQIEFNPGEVAGYRLIGYENRVMAAADFNDDKKDAGELGSGHTVTALYEVILKGGAVPAGDALKYQTPAPSAVPAGNAAANAAPGELLTVKLRYKEPDGSESRLLEQALKGRETSLESMSSDFKFAAAVASFGMLLRGSKQAGNATFASVESLAADGVGNDEKRREFLELVRRAKSPGRPASPGPGHCRPDDPLCTERQ
jgi:Ca-activated chloride channel family protein